MRSTPALKRYSGVVYQFSTQLQLQRIEVTAQHFFVLDLRLIMSVSLWVCYIALQNITNLFTDFHSDCNESCDTYTIFKSGEIRDLWSLNQKCFGFLYESFHRNLKKKYEQISFGLEKLLPNLAVIITSQKKVSASRSNTYFIKVFSKN